MKGFDGNRMRVTVLSCARAFVNSRQPVVLSSVLVGGLGYLFLADFSFPSDPVSWFSIALLIVFSVLFLYGIKHSLLKKAYPTEKYLIVGKEKLPWDIIESITVKHTELSNLHMKIHFKDNTLPKGINIEWLNNKEELIAYVKDHAAEKGFTLSFKEGALPQEDMQEGIEIPPYLRGDSEVKPSPKISQPSPKTSQSPPKISISRTHKMIVAITLAIVSFRLFYHIFGELIAISLFIVILVHEMGHLVALKIFDLKVHGLFFIPLVGAAVISKEEFPSAEAEAAIALAGPAAGLLINLGAHIIDPSSDFFLKLYFYVLLVNLVVNLLNLMPILPLDGGRTVRAALLRGKKSLIPIGIITVGAGVVLVILLRDIILALFVLLGLASFIYSYRRIEKEEVSPPTWRNTVVILAAWIAIMLLYWYTIPNLPRVIIKMVFSQGLG